MRRYKHQDFLDFRQQVFQQNGGDFYGNGIRTDDSTAYDYYQPSRSRSKHAGSSRWSDYQSPYFHMDPVDSGAELRAGAGAALLDHYVNGPDHRVEEPLEGNQQGAKLSYSLAGPFNRKVIGFDHGGLSNGTMQRAPSPRLAPPRIVSPDVSPRGGDSSSESSTCNRLKRRLMGFGSGLTSPDPGVLVNGLSGSEKNIAQFQQRIRRQQLHEKENRHLARMSQSSNSGIPNNCPSGRIDEKPGLRSSALSRKVVQGPTGQQYRGFSRSAGTTAASRTASSAAEPYPGTLQRSADYADSFTSVRHVDSVSSLHSQHSLGKKPMRRDDISTRSWRKGQELILRELGPNKHAGKSKREACEEPAAPADAPEENSSDNDRIEGTQPSVISAAKRNKLSSSRPAPASSAVEGSGSPARPKTRHYDVAEVRSYLRKRQELRKRKRQEEEAASRAKMEHIRQQVADLREQQLVAMTRRRVRPSPPLPQPEKPSGRPNLNKTFTIGVLEGAEDSNAEPEGASGEEEEEARGTPPLRSHDAPMTLEDLEAPGELGYRPPREKYHEVWPAMANGGDLASSNGPSGPGLVRQLSGGQAGGGDAGPEPPVEVASRLTALEESATLLQSRLWQLAQRFGSNAAASHATPEEPTRTPFSQSVPYRVSAPSSVASDVPPAYLSRYDRLRWHDQDCPLDQDDDLPGNNALPDSHSMAYQCQPAFPDDSTSDDVSVTESSPPIVPKQAFRQDTALSHPSEPLIPAFSRSQPLPRAHQRSRLTAAAVTKRKPPAGAALNEMSLDKDPFSFMRTFRKQRHHLHLRGDSEPDEEEEFEREERFAFRSGLHRGSDETSETSESHRDAEDEEEEYTEDFSPVQSRELVDSVRLESREEEAMEVEYEDDFTSMAGPSSSVRTSGEAPRTKARSSLMSSEEVLEEDEPDVSADLEARDELGELPPGRARFESALPRGAATLRLAGAGPEVPPSDGRLSPGSLERRLLAELHYLESMEESVRQLTDIERVRAVSLSQQETVSLAQLLKARQVSHAHELQESRLTAQQQQLSANLQLEETRQRFATAADQAAQSMNQVRTEGALLMHESTRRIVETHHEATQAAVTAAHQLAQAKLTMSTGAGPRTTHDEALQVTLSRSTRSGGSVHSQASSGSQPPVPKVGDPDDDESWLSRTRSSIGDTDVDDSTLHTDTPKLDHRSSSSSVDEDELDHSFRQVLPSEDHRRRGRRAKKTAPPNHGATAADGGSTLGGTEESKSSSFRRFTDDMVRQYMREEEVRSQHQTALLKLRKNALGEKMKTELEFLETQKRQLAKQQGGQPRERQQANLKQIIAKQTALVRRWKEEASEIDKLLMAQQLADERRRIMLEQDAQIGKMKKEAQVRQMANDAVDGKRPRKKSLSDREQRLHHRRQRAEELIKWQEKLQQEERRVQELEHEAIKIWNGSKAARSDTASSDGSIARVASSGTSSSSSSPPSVRRKPEPSSEATAASSSEGSSARPPRLRLKVGASSSSSITEEVSTESNTTSQESVVLSARPKLKAKASEDSSIQEEVPASTRNDSDNSMSIPEEMTRRTPTPTASIRTETVPEESMNDASSAREITSAATSLVPTRSRSPPSVSYSQDTFESASNTTSRLKRRLRGSVPTSLTSPRAPLRPTVSTSTPSHVGGQKAAGSEDEDSYATTTVSDATEMSEMEGRLHALKEDLKYRVRTVNRLKREKARVNRERLKQKEELLHKHIEMYDNYISDLKAELDQDPRDSSLLDSSLIPLVKPLIKAPRATTRHQPEEAATPTATKEKGRSEDEEEEEDYSMSFTASATRSKVTNRERQDSEEVASVSSVSEAVKSAKSVGEDYSSFFEPSQSKRTSEKSTRDLSSEISEQLPSGASSSASSATSRRTPARNDSEGSSISKPKSHSEVSENLPSLSSAKDHSSARSSLSKSKALDQESSSSSTHSLSELLPSSVSTKAPSVASEKTEGKTNGGGAEDEEIVTPRTPRKLTFSEINEEYSASDPETKSKDSGESEPLMVLKPLPALDLRAASPEVPKSPSPQPPGSPPHALEEKVPMSARTIHSQMSDIPEDPPCMTPSERTEEDYSYSEEFSTASSRALSRSQASEALPSRSRSSSPSSSATSTMTPSGSAVPAGSGTASVQEILEPGASEAEEEEEEIVAVLPLKEKEILSLSPEPEHKERDIVTFSPEPEHKERDIVTFSPEPEHKERDIVTFSPEPEHKEEIQSLLPETEREEKELLSSFNSEKNEPEIPSFSSLLEKSLEMVRSPSPERRSPEAEAAGVNFVSEPEKIEEEQSPVSLEAEKKAVQTAKPKVSEEKVAVIVADILRQTLHESLRVSLTALRRPHEVLAAEEKEEGVADIESVTSVTEEEKAPTEPASGARDDGKKSPVRAPRGESPPLSWTSTVELAAEDEMASELDRLLAQRRQRRRLSSDADASPPVSPSPAGASPLPLADQGSPVPALQDVPFNSLVTSSPAVTAPAPKLDLLEPAPTILTPEEPPAPSLSTFAVPSPVPSPVLSAAPAPEDDTPAPSRASTPPLSQSESLSVAEEASSTFVVPHTLAHLREMSARAVDDLWPHLCGPAPPRLDRLPSQPSFDFCLIGEEDLLENLETPSVPEETLVRSRRAYKRMVYNLILDTVRRVYAEEPNLQPWMCARPTRFRLWRDTKPPDCAERLLSIVEEEIGTHMGFMMSRKRESKLTRWSRRKRVGLGSGASAAISVDPVDDLLKSELRTEEADWVNYEAEEVQVKLQVAESILADLIDDTVQAIQTIGLDLPTPPSAIPAHLARDISVGWLDDSNPSLIL